MKTQDGKSILIDIENEGWKFSSQGYTIDLETGLYFGKKILLLKTKICLFQVLHKKKTNSLNGNLKK